MSPHLDFIVSTVGLALPWAGALSFAAGMYAAKDDTIAETFFYWGLLSAVLILIGALIR